MLYFTCIRNYPSTNKEVKMVKVTREVSKAIMGGVGKELKNLWCNAFLSDKPIKLESKGELNAGLQTFNVSKYEGLGTMGLLGNVKAGKIKSITVKKENDIPGNRKATILKVEKVGKLDPNLSVGKISA